jgi:hypothetical protein
MYLATTLHTCLASTSAPSFLIIMKLTHLCSPVPKWDSHADGDSISKLTLQVPTMVLVPAWLRSVLPKSEQCSSPGCFGADLIVSITGYLYYSGSNEATPNYLCQPNCIGIGGRVCYRYRCHVFERIVVSLRGGHCLGLV